MTIVYGCFVAIRIVEGVPGSGKSYFAVHHLLTKYFRWDKDLSEWVKKDEWATLVLVTNIDGFPYSVPLEKLVEGAGSLEQFFTYEYQEQLSAGAPYVYLIDEAQGLFPYTYRDTRVFLFFQKHRHLGMDIYLITQDADHLAKGLRSLSEFHIVAARRSLSFAGELRYRFVDPQTRECWQTKVLKKDGRIFSFYKSFSALETEKQASVPRRFFFMFAAAVVVVLLVFYWGFIYRLRKADATTPPVAVAPVKKSLIPVRGNFQKLSTPAVPQAKPKETPIYGHLIGTYELASQKGFLVEVAGFQVRLDQPDFSNLCKCDVGSVAVGKVVVVDVATAPAPIMLALSRGGGGDTGGATPLAEC